MQGGREREREREGEGGRGREGVAGREVAGREAARRRDGPGPLEGFSSNSKTPHLRLSATFGRASLKFASPASCKESANMMLRSFRDMRLSST